MFVQRKIESDGSTSEDIKKPRTAEAGNGYDEDVAGPVMGECTVMNSDGAAAETSEDENGMSVDLVVEDRTTAAAISSHSTATDLPATTATQSVSISSVNDVIDVDAIDSENSGAQKDQSVVEAVNPLELGLNEYYLEPASDERPSGDVIDVDDENTQTAAAAAGLADTAAVTASDAGSDGVSLEWVEEKSRGKATSEVDTEPETASRELRDDKLEEGPATGVEKSHEKVTSEVDTETETGSREVSDGKSEEGPASVEVQSIETVASSSPSAVQKKSSAATAPGNADNVSTDLAADRSNNGEASDSCTEVQETDLVVASSTEHHESLSLEAVSKVDTDVAEMVTQVTGSAVTSQECSIDKAVVVDPNIPVEVEQQAGSNTKLTSPRAAVETERGMLSAMNTPQAEDVPSDCSNKEATAKPVQHVSGDSRDEEMMVNASQTGVAEALGAGSTSVQMTENLTECRDVTDRRSSDGESTAERVTDRDTAGLSSEVRRVEDSEENCEGMKADVSQAAAVSEECTSLSKKETVTDVNDVTDKASPDNCTTEMTDEPVSGTAEANESVKMADVVIPDSEATEERNGAATVNIADAAQRQEPLLTENVMDATEGRNVTDRSGGESATQLVADSDETAMDIGSIVSSADETTQGVQQHGTEMMLKADVRDVPDVAVTEETVVAVNSEKCDLELKDVTDNTETSQQSVDMIAETNNSKGTPEVKEMTDVAVTDNAENGVTMDESRSQLKEMTDMAVIDNAESVENPITTDENTSQLKDMEDMAVTAEQQNEVLKDVALSDKTEDKDLLPTESGTLTTSVSSVAQSVNKTTDKIETTAQDTTLTQSHVGDDLGKHAADCGKTDVVDMSGMELKTDETSVADEIAVTEAVAKVHGGSSEQEEMEMTVNAPTLAADAAEQMINF